MKRRKVVLLIVLFILFLVFEMFSNVQAATSSPGKTLCIKFLRESGYGYILGNSNKKIWKIYELNGKKGQTIYCLKGGPGFGSYEATIKQQIYNQNFNLREFEEIPTLYKSALPTNTKNFASLMWLLDNIYVPAVENASQNERDGATQNKNVLLEAAQNYADTLPTEPDLLCLTDDDIDAVQQLAIWYFTNSEEDYHISSKEFTFYLNSAANIESSVTQPLTNFREDGWERQSACVALFKYLVKTAEDNSNYDYNNISQTRPVEFEDTTIIGEKKNGRLILGPYKIKDLGSNSDYSLNAEVTTADGSKVTNVKYLKNDKNTSVSNIKDLVGQSFYISVPDNTDTKNIKLKISGSFFTTKATYWSVENQQPEKDQPVVILEKKTISFEDEKTYTEKIFDLALRKFIIQIGNEEIKSGNKYSREPVISSEELQKLQNGSVTTANKVHTKTPLPVKTGDKVVYKIRVYNEGEVAGYAKKVTDYLPEGLDYVTDSDINRNNGWQYSSSDRSVTTTHLENQLINAFNGETLSYKDLEIECQVSAIASSSITELTNIAEITEHQDKDGNMVPLKDRDSEPGNVNKEQYKTEVKSQQDDDDFERLVLSEAVGDYSIELEKVDSKDETKKLQGAEFKVTIDEQSQICTTNSQGKFSISKISITNENTQTIKIEEIKAPTGYSNQKPSITLTVETELKDGKYVIKQVTSTQAQGFTMSFNSGKISMQLKNYQLDLALRKFIIKIADKDIKEENKYIREPDISSEQLKKLQDGTVTTADKVHTKEPLEVKTGDRVVYIIRVYNEGEIAAYAKKVTDYLPEGLKFVENSNINNEYHWTNPSEDGKTIETDYLQNELLRAFNGNALDYRDIKIECEVIALPDATNKELTNIAEITEHSDEYGDKTVKDRDSEPKNVDKENYENKSQQDDDDFERLTLKKATGEYEVELEKLDSQYSAKKLQGAEFKVIVNGGEPQTCTTNEQGKITISNIKIAEEGTQIITIQETKAPKGYSNQGETITLTITTALENGEYIIKDVKKSEVKGLTMSFDSGKISMQLKNYQLDLALRKFIIKIADKDIKIEDKYTREPSISEEEIESLKNGEKTTAEKEHTKEPLEVKKGDKVIYVIRVYNEGEIAAYAKEVTDYLPDGLKFVENSNINDEYHWTNPSGDGKTIKTDFLKSTLLKAFDGESLDYRDLQVECEVIATNDTQSLKNIAEITKHSDSNGDETVKDRDSDPENVDKENYGDKSQQDDDDFENLKLKRFDLALRKFITAVEDTEITNRVPVYNRETNTYTHPKDPVEVANGNVVTYTLRVFNEGNTSGYATKIKDDLPDGLVFLPEHETNIEYRWKMYTAKGEETQNVEEAKYIETDYLSKEQEETEGENLLDAFTEEMTMPDYKDVKIAFKVTEPNTSDRIITNIAEITEDTDEDGNPIEDVDSEPNNDKEDEDDIDEEHIKVKYFDLSLKKWVSESIVTYNGKTTVNKTGHTGDENPEAPAKVEIKSNQLSKTTVKFRFVIKVTNEGEIAGYAKEIIDYIPAGLTFNQADNKLWREEDGKVLTDQLKDKLLQPGESATVEIVLTWKNSKDNLGQKVNWAEIYEDENEYNSPDIDSTPGNDKEGEDDIDEAPVILSIKTGETPTYIVLALSSVAMLSSGVILIKKFVL